VDTVKQAVSFSRPEEPPPLPPSSPITLHSNGLAYVSPVAIARGEARHPIYDLITNATAQCAIERAGDADQQVGSAGRAAVDDLGRSRGRVSPATLARSSGWL